jgi:hypothetical protein
VTGFCVHTARLQDPVGQTALVGSVLMAALLLVLFLAVVVRALWERRR